MKKLLSIMLVIVLFASGLCFTKGEIKADVHSVIFGDVTHNGKVEVSDVSKLYSYVLGELDFTEEEKILGDVNGDEKVDQDDVDCLYDAVTDDTTDSLPIYSILLDAGSCGDNVKYIVKNNKEMIIFGEGAMDDYFMSEAPYQNQSSNIKRVVFKNGITHIGNYAFYFMVVTNVVFPDSLVSIGDSAFCDSSLVDISLPDGLVSIGSDAFSYCFFSSVNIPSTVTSLSQGAFSGCNYLEEINVSSQNNKYSSENGVLFNKNKTSLLKYPSAKKDTRFVLPESVLTIERGACSDTQLEEIVLNDNLETIKRAAFSYSKKIKELIIPEKVTSVGVYSFRSMDDLEKITFLNYKCNISDDAQIPDTATIYGYKNSTSEIYATENDITFVSLGSMGYQSIPADTWTQAGAWQLYNGNDSWCSWATMLYDNDGDNLGDTSMYITSSPNGDWNTVEYGLGAKLVNYSADKGMNADERYDAKIKINTSKAGTIIAIIEGKEYRKAVSAGESTVTVATFDHDEFATSTDVVFYLGMFPKNTELTISEVNFVSNPDEWTPVPNYNPDEGGTATYTHAGKVDLFAMYGVQSRLYGKMKYKVANEGQSIADTTIKVTKNSGWLDARSVCARLTNYCSAVEVKKGDETVTGLTNGDYYDGTIVINSNKATSEDEHGKQKNIRMILSGKEYDYPLSVGDNEIKIEDFKYTGKADIDFGFDCVDPDTELVIKSVSFVANDPDWTRVENEAVTNVGAWQLFARTGESAEEGQWGALSYKNADGVTTPENPEDTLIKVRSSSGWHNAWATMATLPNYISPEGTHELEVGHTYRPVIKYYSSKATKMDDSGDQKTVLFSVDNNNLTFPLEACEDESDIKTVKLYPFTYKGKKPDYKYDCVFNLDQVEPKTVLRFVSIEFLEVEDAWTPVPNFNPDEGGTATHTHAGKVDLLAMYGVQSELYGKMKYMVVNSGHNISDTIIKVTSNSGWLDAWSASARLTGYCNTVKVKKGEETVTGLTNGDYYNGTIVINSNKATSEDEHGKQKNIRIVLSGKAYDYPLQAGDNEIKIEDFKYTGKADIDFELDCVDPDTELIIKRVSFAENDPDWTKVENETTVNVGAWQLFARTGTTVEEGQWGALSYKNADGVTTPENPEDTLIKVRSSSGWHNAWATLAMLPNFLSPEGTHKLKIGHAYRPVIKYYSSKATETDDSGEQKTVLFSVDNNNSTFPLEACTDETDIKTVTLDPFTYEEQKPERPYDCVFNLDQVEPKTVLRFVSIEFQEVDDGWNPIDNDTITSVGNTGMKLYARFNASEYTWGRTSYKYDDASITNNYKKVTIKTRSTIGWYCDNPASFVEFSNIASNNMTVGNNYKIRVTLEANRSDEVKDKDGTGEEAHNRIKLVVDGSNEYIFGNLPDGAEYSATTDVFKYEGKNPNIRLVLDEFTKNATLRIKSIKFIEAGGGETTTPEVPTDVTTSKVVETTTPEPTTTAPQPTTTAPVETTTKPVETTTNNDIEELRQLYNQLSERLNEQISDCNSQISDLSARLGQLQSQVDSNDSELREKISSLESQLTAAQNKLSNIESGINDIESDVNNNSISIAELQSEMDDVQDALDTVDTRISTAKTEVEATVKDYVDAQVAVINNQLDTLGTAINGLNTLIGEIPDGTNLQSEINDIQSSIQTIQNQLSSVDLSQIETNKQQIEALGSQLVTITNTISQNLSTEIQNRISDTARLSNAISDINSSLQAKDQYLQTQVNSLNNQLQTANTDIEAINSTITQIQNDISANASNIQDNADSINELVKQLNGCVTELKTVDDRIKTAQDGAVALSNEYTDQKVAEVKEMINTLNELVGKVPENTNLQKQINDLEANVKAIESEVGSADLKQIETNKKQISDLSSQLLSITTTLTQGLAKETQDRINDVGGLNSDINSLNEKLALIQKAVDDNAAKIKEMEDSKKTETPSSKPATPKAPGKVKLKKLKAKKKRCIVNWNAVPKASGYQIYYKQKKAKKITITGNKLKRTIKNLKSKKKVSVKVRAFVLNGANKIFGAWSATKKIKVK